MLMYNLAAIARFSSVIIWFRGMPLNTLSRYLKLCCEHTPSSMAHMPRRSLWHGSERRCSTTRRCLTCWTPRCHGTVICAWRWSVTSSAGAPWMSSPVKDTTGWSAQRRIGSGRQGTARQGWGSSRFFQMLRRSWARRWGTSTTRTLSLTSKTIGFYKAGRAAYFRPCPRRLQMTPSQNCRSWLLKL